MNSMQKKGLIGFGGILGLFLLWYILKKINIVVDAVLVVGAAIAYIHVVREFLKFQKTIWIDGASFVIAAITTVLLPLPFISYLAMGVMAVTGVNLYKKFVLDNKNKTTEG